MILVIVWGLRAANFIVKCAGFLYAGLLLENEVGPSYLKGIYR